MFNEGAFQAILSKVSDERIRQERLKAAGKFPYTPEDPQCSNQEALTILVEEVGEVARALQEKDVENLKDELIQVAAVAVAWVEGIHNKAF